MALFIVLTVTAMTATFTSGLVYFILAGVSSDGVALFEKWGSILLYVWAIGVWGFSRLLGDYPYGKLAPDAEKGNYGYFGGARTVMGYQVPNRLAWFVQEVPAFIVPVACWSTAPAPLEPTNQLILLMFMIHYFQRSFIYAFRIRDGKGVPLSLMLCCLFFCAGNGLLQGVTLTRYYTFKESHLYTPQFMVGFVIWIAGLFINVQADGILINLRKPGDTERYKIPYGGAFEYVSGANFFGEIVEWYGWAIAGGHGTGVAFAVFTMFNIAPRACATHDWYVGKFKDDYPKSRKRVVPFLY